MKGNFTPLGLAAAVATVCGGYGIASGEVRRKHKPWKDCLHCGKPHQHNNAFCSPECCKDYRALSFNTTAQTSGEVDSGE